MYEHNPALTSYQSACELLASEGLPCPPVPRKFTRNLRQTRYSALFTTNPSLPDPYHFLFYFNQVLAGKSLPMVAFGVSGHGVYSRAMHYYLIDEHIAVLLQDGLPDEAGGWRIRQEQDYDAVSQLFIACQDAVQSHKLAGNKKLVICRSFFVPGQWGVIRQTAEKELWHYADNPLLAGIDWLLDNNQ